MKYEQKGRGVKNRVFGIKISDKGEQRHNMKGVVHIYYSYTTSSSSHSHIKIILVFGNTNLLYLQKHTDLEFSAGKVNRP